jgi:fibronectin-binding autotransporter adhesin
VNYTYTGTPGSGSTVAGAANWGNTPWSSADTLVEGGIYLKIPNQTSPTLTVKGGGNAANSYNRGSFSGVQIENTYAGTLSFWDTNGTSTGAGGASPSGNWSDANWSSSAAGAATPGAWTSGNAAVFAAGSDATGPYTVNLGGTQTTDIVWVQEGQITFAGGQLDLTGTGTLRSDGTGSITANAPIGGSNISTVGSVTLNAANVHTGSTSVLSGALLINGGSAIPDVSGVVVNGGASLLVGASETIGSLQGSGTVALDVNTLTVTNSGTNNYAGIFTGTGAAVLTGTGTVTLTGSSASFPGSLTVGAGLTVQVANSATVFGTSAGSTTVQNGGTIMIASATGTYNQPGAGENFNIVGAGVGGVGALSSNGGGGGVIRQLTLTGDATIGGTSRWDIGGGGASQQAVINGGGFTLTKTGTNNIWMRGTAGGSSITNLAALVINQGVYGVEFGDNALGSTPVTVNPTAAFSAWTANPTNTQGNPIILNGGTLDVDAGGITFSGAITLAANSNMNSNDGNMTVSGPIGETGGARNLTKTAGNTLTLTGTNTYTGATTVNAGILAVEAVGFLNYNSRNLYVGGSSLAGAIHCGLFGLARAEIQTVA